MKRRNFIGNVSLGIAGIGISEASSNQQKGAATESLSNLSSPEYRKKIKKTFSTTNLEGENDKVVLALIGAGNWETVLSRNLVGLDKNVD